MTGVFLQVRLGSSRLPNKALLELDGKTMIEHAMHSLKRVPATVHAILTDPDSQALLTPRAREWGYDVFVGSREDVLQRYVTAARHYGVDEIVRATGDNPLVSWELARLLVKLFRETEADYAGFDGPPLGTGVEVLRRVALERAIIESSDPYDHEHVAPFLYRNPHRFLCQRVAAPPAYCYPSARVTVDTVQDYQRVREVFRGIAGPRPVPVLRLVRWLKANDATRASTSSGAGALIDVDSAHA